MKFIDTHTHLYDKAFGNSDGQDDAIKRALEKNVVKLIFPDESSSTREKMFGLCSRWPGTAYPCLGVHPTELGGDWKKELELLDEAVGKHRKEIVAIGECGMDFHWDKDNGDVQEEVFRHQIELSLLTSLPLIIHVREATDRIFSILDDYRGRGLRGVFHAFSGSLETFRRLDSYGDWYVGIGGVVTFRNAGIASLLEYIPSERILLETDSPYLTPVPHRGERNESAYIPLIAAFIAARKNLVTEEFALTAYNNSLHFFDLPN